MIHFTTKFLMWQPFAHCQQNCKDCYVKKSFFQNHRPFAHWTTLSSILYGSLKVTEEIILSVDCRKEFYAQERVLLSAILAIPTIRPEINIQLAVRDWHTVSHLLRTATLKGIENPIKNLSRISVSDMSDFLHYSFTMSEWEKTSSLSAYHARFRIPTQINWNYLVDLEETADFHEQHLLKHIQFVDTLHLILKKPPLGQTYDPRTIQHYNSVLAKCREQEAIDKKLYIDTCNIHWFNALKLNLGKVCNAEEKIHMWPNGIVTVCPYDSYGRANHHRKETGFIEQFNYMKKDNPFWGCKLNHHGVVTGENNAKNI